MPDIPYQRPAGQKRYSSISKHQVHARNRFSKWVSIRIERLTFDTADYGTFNHNTPQPSWMDANGNMWGFMHRFVNVGVDGEQFGYFENPNNPVNHWHGFPVTPFSQKRYVIDNTLLTLWVASGHFDEDDIPALKQKRRIR